MKDEIEDESAAAQSAAEWVPDELPKGMEDITPEGSEVPIFRDPNGEASPDGPGPADLLQEAEAVRVIEAEAACEDLVALGISAERARTIVGLPPL